MAPLSYLLLRPSSENEKNESAAENFFSQLSEIFRGKNITIAAEIVIYNKFLWFFIASPPSVSEIIAGQWYSQYGNVEIEKSKDYLSRFFSGKWNIDGLEFHLEHSEWIPFTTYRELEKNPLISLSGITSSFQGDDMGAVQLILKSPPEEDLIFKSKKKIRELARARRNTRLEMTKIYTELEEIKEEKGLFKTSLRFISASKDHERGKMNLSSMAAVYKKALERPKLQRFKEGHEKHGIRYLKEFSERTLSRNLFNRYRFWIGPDEAATFFHLPYKNEGISQIVEVLSKKAPPPENLPTETNTVSSNLTVFGRSNYQNGNIKFGIRIPDRRRHLYVIGKTGMGKSKLLDLLIASDLKNGRGVILLDPHGDLAKEITGFIPESRLDDVVYFDPSDLDYPIGFNPMEGVGNFEFKQNIVVGFISIFKKLFGYNWNERFEHVLRYTTLALLDYPQASVLGITRMLTDNLFRQEVLGYVSDPLVKKFWTTEYASWNEQFATEAIVPIINKIGQFIANPMIRNIVGQSRTGFSLEEIMNREKIFIANLSIGKLGEENSALLGSMLVTKIWQTAIARTALPEKERKDTFLYVDEFQNFATSAFANILSEARKYRLNLTVAHQYTEQLSDEVRATVFGNVGNLICFRIGGEDAQVCVKEYEPTFGSNDFLNLNIRNFLIKMSIDGQTAKPFSGTTLEVEKGNDNNYSKIKALSRAKWARSRREAEEEIIKWESGSLTEKGTAIKGQLVDEFPEPLV